MLLAQIGVILIFALTFFLIMFRPWRLGILHSSGIGLLLLLLFNLLTPSQAFEGFIGTKFVHPYGAVFFIAAISFIFLMLERLGFFKWAALKTAQLAKNNGRKLFIYLYLVICVITMFTSNDIVILALTPFIIYLTKYLNINPIPFLIAEFFGANIGSMALPIGNPTNIIVFSSMGLNFLSYMKYMIFPTLVAIGSSLGILYLVFQKKIPSQIKITEIKEAQLALNSKYALPLSFLTILFFLIFCSIATFLGSEVWLASIIFAALFAVILQLLPDFNFSKALLFSLREFPFKILIFVTFLFMMIPALSVHGIIPFISQVLTQAIDSNLIKAAFGTGFSSVIIANLLNNIPMTILFTNILADPSFLSLPLKIKSVSIYTLIAGSNLAANITLIGALAGLMWIKILSARKIKISRKEFFTHGILVTPLVMILTFLTILIEHLIF